MLYPAHVVEDPQPAAESDGVIEARQDGEEPVLVAVSDLVRHPDAPVSVVVNDVDLVESDWHIYLAALLL